MEGQRLLLSASDILLGWQTTREPDGVVRDYYVRQLRDGKGDFDVTAMSPTALTSYARSCGWTSARAHARAGDRAAIAQYLGTSDRFEQVLIEFAAQYADKNERDYTALRAAVESGRVITNKG